MTNKTRTKKSNLFQDINDFFFNNTCVKKNWLGFLSLCFIMGVLDIGTKHFYNHYIAELKISFINNTVIRLCHMLQDNFMELFLSQISITFLVTSLLSIFGSNEKYIYWENAIEYKLIRPQGESFRDITAYCLGTLPLSIIAIIFKFNLLFVLSFSINIIGLTVITVRMFTIYFCDRQIRKEMETEFFALTSKVQNEKILLLEANTYRHIQNFNLSGIFENTEFLNVLANKQDPRNFDLVCRTLLRIYNALPHTFPDIKTNILTTLFNITGIIDCENSSYKLLDFFAIEPFIQENIRHQIKNHKISLQKTDNKPLESLKESVFLIAQDNLYKQNIADSQKTEILHFYEMLAIQAPLNRILNLINTQNVYTKDHKIDFTDYFYRGVELIKMANTNMCNLAPYVCSLKRLYNYIYNIGLMTLQEKGLDPISRAKTNLNEDELKKLPDSILDVVKCFNEETALSIFKILCDDYAINSDKNIVLSLLNDIYSSTLNINDTTKKKMISFIENSSIIYKEELIKTINTQS